MPGIQIQIDYGVAHEAMCAATDCGVDLAGED